VAALSPERIRAHLAEVQEEVGPGVQVLAATKYVALEDMGALVEAGVTLCGENRAQDLAAKAAAYPGLVYDFIGQLQSRKVKQVLPLVRWIHSVASDSALRELGKHGTPDTEVLVEVNVAGEEGKAGVAPGELGAFIERCPVRVVGLMTMPPFAGDPEDSRRWFAALRELAAAHGLRELSMGTSQDYAVAAQEGATVVRVGSRLYT
jgi:PLP dependent protein